MNRKILMVLVLTTVVSAGVVLLSASLNAQEQEGAAPVTPGDGGDAPAADGQDTEQAPRAGFLQSPMFMIMIIFALFYFIMLRPGQRKEKDRNLRVTTIEKNSQVITRGGIIGKVISVNEDLGELMILTDDKTDTRLKVSRSGIWDLYEPTESVEQK
ncbi:MAG: preprotein translocase subunit YajC [Pirellulaceae bacterium]